MNTTPTYTKLTLSGGVILALLVGIMMGNSSVLQWGERLFRVMRPIYYGIVLAFLLSPMHQWFMTLCHRFLPFLRRKEGITNGIAIFLSLMVVFLLLYLLLGMMIPELYLSISALVDVLPTLFPVQTPSWLYEVLGKNPALYATMTPYYEGILAHINHWLETEVTPLLHDHLFAFAQMSLLPVVNGVSQFLGAMVSLFFDSIVAVIVSIYLLYQKNHFMAQGRKFVYGILPTRGATVLLEELHHGYGIISGFITGKWIDSLIIGGICLIGCSLLKLPYTPLIATIIGVTNIIPFFGPFIGAIPCAILICCVSPIQCLYFVGFIVALQQFDGNILGPNIIGASTGLGSFWVLFSILLFGGLWGVKGMIFAVPIFAIFYHVLSRYLEYALRKKNLPLETSAYEQIFLWEKEPCSK